jgi:mRNA-degrading endonuclease RelE of RelBE toxin-antitoxin system
MRWRSVATYQLRIGDYRVFYDVAEAEVVVIAVLHKKETAEFYREEA